MENLAEKISDSELEVMRVLWDARTALPVGEIRRALQERRGWEATTIKTLVQRLVAKGAVAQEKRGRSTIRRSCRKRNTMTGRRSG